MALTVVVRSGDLSTPASITFDAPRIVIGRGAGCEVRLPDPSVSHRHASIRQRGTDYVVIDEGSTNGTFVGPVRLSPQAPRILRSGDLLRVGRIWLEVRVEQAMVTAAHQLVTREIALSLVAGALGTQGDPSGPEVRVARGPDMQSVLWLSEAERPYLVGRGAGVDLSIEDNDLSRKHLELVRRGLQVFVRDLSSKNGTELDGVRLPAEQAVPWPPGGRLVLGDTELSCEDRVRSALDALDKLPDESMNAEDPVDPPTGIPAPAAMSELPRASAPAPSVPREALGERATPGLLDLMIALVALIVLGVSLLGLWLLFRS